MRAKDRLLSFADLEDLIRSGYVQGAGQLGIWFSNDVCNVDDAELTSPAFDVHLDRVARLLRLSRDLGWSIQDTDRAITVFRESPQLGALESSDISESLLLSLASLVWLQRTLQLNVAELLDWWGASRHSSMARADNGCVFRTGYCPARLVRASFRERPSANAGGADAALSPFQKMVGTLDDDGLFAVLDDGSELAGSRPRIADHLDAVASAVGCEPQELNLLLGTLGATATLTLEHLSQVNRQIKLASALGINHRTLLQQQEWTNIDPFTSPLNTIRFVLELRQQYSVACRHRRS